MSRPQRFGNLKYHKLPRDLAAKGKTFYGKFASQKQAA